MAGLKVLSPLIIHDRHAIRLTDQGIPIRGTHAEAADIISDQHLNHAQQSAVRQPQDHQQVSSMVENQRLQAALSSLPDLVRHYHRPEHKMKVVIVVGVMQVGKTHFCNTAAGIVTGAVGNGIFPGKLFSIYQHE